MKFAIWFTYYTEHEIHTHNNVYTEPDDELDGKRCNNIIYSHETNTKC